jgi:hypothetical protein
MSVTYLLQCRNLLSWETSPRSASEEVFHLLHDPEVRGLFEKFVDLPYYSESELCGGAVTVFFTKYFPWQAMHILQRSTLFSKTCCKPLITWNFLPRSPIFMVGRAQKSHGARSELNFVFGLQNVDRWNPIRTSAIQSRSRPMRFLGISNHEKGAQRQEISKWLTICSTFPRSGWSVVKSASPAKGGTSKKRPLPHLHKFPTRSNKVSPWNFQTTFIYYSVHKSLSLEPILSHINST